MATQTGIGKTSYSVLGSGLLHAGVAVILLTLHFTPPETPELITIEIKTPSEKTLFKTKQNPLLLEPDERKAAKVPTPAPRFEDQAAANEASVALPAQQTTKSPVSAKSLPSKQIAVDAKPSPAQPAPTEQARAVKRAATEPASKPAARAQKAAPANSAPSEDLDTSDFEQSLAAQVAAPSEAKLDDSDLNDGIEKASAQAAAQLAAADAGSLPEVDSVMAESEVLASQARQNEKARALAMAKSSAARRAQDEARLQQLQAARAQSQSETQQQQRAQAQARAKAQEEARAKALASAQAHYQASKAAATQAAREAAEGDARDQAALAEQAAADEAAIAAAAAQAQADAQARAQAEKAQRAQQAQAASERGNRQGKAEAPQGPADSGALMAGGESAAAIRALEDLRQMPGNRRPHYDEEDQLARRTGDVIFRAYISKEGTPSQFKLVQSSGHRTLDGKTFKAIRTWKFYPGQEGWVEIPFRWDLRGEPQPIGGTLRKVSQK